ncbi:MAG: flagellar basal body L-ring protein FlgH, partial [bacterium]|nr:flagellar basal body L-ring protein FlgH [bacterium]MDW8164330.1 hypothetical protein [Candidatus Omnitrophota bacterium]
MLKKIFTLLVFLTTIVIAQENNMFFLYSDIKALKKGDIVKIVILEKASTNEKVSTTTGKKYNTKGEISVLPFGEVSK